MTKTGITSAPFLRGKSGSSNIKAWRGKAGWKEAQALKLKMKPKKKLSERGDAFVAGATGAAVHGAATAELKKDKKKKNTKGRTRKFGGGRIGLREGTKPLETAMHKKRAQQTQNVKRLTTSDDAYSPERRVLQVEKKTPYGTTGTRKVITDWHNIKEEGKKLKEKFVKKYGSGNLSIYDPPKKTRPQKGKKVGKGRIVSIKPHRRAEISRVHRELNKGYKSGGAVLKGKKVGIQIK